MNLAKPKLQLRSSFYLKKTHSCAIDNHSKLDIQGRLGRDTHGKPSNTGLYKAAPESDKPKLDLKMKTARNCMK
jgi:hypothetical protein